jgi:primary-amine oxidase
MAAQSHSTWCQVRCAALCTFVATSSALAATHPLDPLDADEIIGAATLLLNGHAASPGAIFQSVELREPHKQVVLNHRPGAALGPRQATVFWRQNKQSFRSTVNLSAGTFSPPQLIPTSDGQLGLTITEVSDFSFAFSDTAFLNALARRGIRSPEQLQKVFITPLTAGSFGLPEEARRIVKAQMYFTAGAAINLYARPIEGLQLIVDLDERRVLRVLDSGVVPVPHATHEFDEASVGALTGLRPEMKPIRITQPAGVNFRFDGNFIEWQKWRFHARFERRAGPVISMISYAGRQVMYQGALAEIFVPYQDAGPNWFYRTFMDAGEFGFGLLASPLALGLDVPENAVLLDALVSAAIPDPTVPVVPLPLPRVLGVFERLTGGPAWRHFESFSGGRYEGRVEAELVVRSISQVGNYDYVIDWIFNQSGVIRVEVGLTGIDAAKAIRGITDDNHNRQSAPVAPQLVAPYHSHHFSFRLDVDIDGQANSFVNGHLKERSAPGPRRTVWSLEEEVVPSEAQGRLEHHNSIWRVINPGRRNAMGQFTGYMVESHDHVEPLLAKADYQRAAFIGYPLWVTAYDADQRYAAGDTPNQHPGAPGLPQYIQDNRSLVNRDIVLWLTLGHHHVTQAEDWPVLSTKRLSFELKPSNFFDRNPALDLRRAPFEVRR